MKSRITIVGEANTYTDVFANILSYEEGVVYTGYQSLQPDASRVINKWKPDVLVVLYESVRAFNFISQVKKKFPWLKQVVIFETEEEEVVIKCMKAGIDGVVHSSSGLMEFLKCIHHVIAGEHYIGSRMMHVIFDTFRKTHNGPLTNRETEVLELLSEGKSYTEVADELFIGKETVRSHIKNIYFKLGVSKKAQAIKIGREQKYI